MTAWMRSGLLGVLLSGLCGCASTEFCTNCCNCCWPAASVIPHGEVKQVMALWADGLVVQADPFRNGIRTPGFSARVHLFGKDLGEPLAADGTLMVQLYDTTHPTSGMQPPLEVWNIDEANLEQLGKKAGLGWGYNLWVPWTTYRPEIHRVSLVVKYQPHRGIPAFSGHSELTVNDGSAVRPPSQLEVHNSSLSPQGLHPKDDGPSVRTSTLPVLPGSSLERLAPETLTPKK